MIDEPGGTVEVAPRHGRPFDEVGITDPRGDITATITAATLAREQAPFEPVEVGAGRSARVRFDGEGDAVAVDL